MINPSTKRSASELPAALVSPASQCIHISKPSSGQPTSLASHCIHIFKPFSGQRTSKLHPIEFHQISS
ncbi:hypothetical protein PtrSN002B_000029 [Pyrenophora tritici-repentis]|uniref:Uncharacterized protein n=2 Tax=Pyrenophora tritici-repentis TaxID=45151 RepID=A0A317BSD6_9PLEO|nr:uncharacterized protein PTRG_07384 [Pyrenophora tritici-repentis Pt-1C-BFP]KAA8614973.1 hypothetical protein PtrV1_12003 [Pyrenophora tritici-repentis]EDU50303.1 predicted protein [Pyrenophora tritici-repentis Pt-1C-BFP]KAI0589210.1 hypothetical protein Alg215_00365 [Pyrenophora tritici-repentis]KAI0614452.1 hypothetical protein TUN205_01295 [Pyrenophora tritici-repentis]KAI0619850.1 hypothetical protein TUN199_08144 [Pyrenophora tritici-repentis]